MGLEVLEKYFLEKLEIYDEKDKRKIIMAYHTAKNAHHAQKRKSGEPYIIHPLEVALILISLHADCATVCAGVLHDVVEDTQMTNKQLASIFGYEVSLLVDGVSKIDITSFESKEAQSIATQRKLLAFFCQDPRVILIKFADRLHNMRTIGFLPEKKQNVKAKENFDFYIPMSYLLGAYEFKNQFEDLSFKVLSKEEYIAIKEMMENYKKLWGEKWIMIMKEVKQICNHNNINLIGEPRLTLKNIYGIFKRLSTNHLGELHDLIAFRLIVNNIDECYKLLDCLHQKYEVLYEFEKDYISRPKTNHYQSLHTTVNTKSSYIQFQIRTKEMEILNTAGIAGYWEINPLRAKDLMRKELQEENFFYQSLKEMHQNIKDNEQFLKYIKNDFLGPNIHVYDSSGKPLEFPLGSTLVDFAYRIHTDLGNTLLCGVVNGKRVGIDYVLKENDYIEVICGKDINPPPLQSAKTNYARQKINKYRR